MRKLKVLMVCLGNICRSPLAEGILRSKVDIDKVEVDSAGTGNYHVGGLPDERSINIAEERGLDITDQRARQFTAQDFEEYDYIFVMDKSNHQNVLKLAPSPEHGKKVELILNQLYPGEDREVPDPYTGGLDGFVDVYDMLDKSTDEFIKKLL